MKKKKKKISVETHLKCQFDDVELPEGLPELQPLVQHAAVTGRADRGPAAEAGYKQTKPQQLHVGVKCVMWLVTGGFFVSKDLLEMQSVLSLTFLYVSLRRQENHSPGAGKLQKLPPVTNEISFPLAVAAT